MNGVQSLQKACWYGPPKLGACLPPSPAEPLHCFFCLFVPDGFDPGCSSICWFPGNYPEGTAVSMLSPDLLLLRGEMVSLAISESQKEVGRKEPKSQGLTSTCRSLLGGCYPGFLELPHAFWVRPPYLFFITRVEAPELSSMQGLPR